MPENGAVFYTISYTGKEFFNVEQLGDGFLFVVGTNVPLAIAAEVHVESSLWEPKDRPGWRSKRRWTMRAFLMTLMLLVTARAEGYASSSPAAAAEEIPAKPKISNRDKRTARPPGHFANHCKSSACGAPLFSSGGHGIRDRPSS